MYQRLENNLKSHLKNLSPRHNFAQVYEYAVFPPGKLFRPLLTIAVAQDLKLGASKEELVNNKSDYAYFASFLELHHAYTLAHDDLPAMDNDNQRRGKDSLHIKFNEWQALLAGDGLLNASYALLGQIKSKHLGLLLRYCSLCLGPRGLIQGQYLDLSGEIKNGIDEVIETHFLKTARLIQCALTGPIIISNAKNKFKNFKRYHRLGRALGISFQLLDDLAELSQKNISIHEKDINPWPLHFEKATKVLTQEIKNISDFFKNGTNTQLYFLIRPYLEKNINLIKSSQNNIESHIKRDLAPILTALEIFTIRNETN
jgi:geranylgeranyl pyrophosphate synthase